MCLLQQLHSRLRERTGRSFGDAVSGKFGGNAKGVPDLALPPVKLMAAPTAIALWHGGV